MSITIHHSITLQHTPGAYNLVRSPLCLALCRLRAASPLLLWGNTFAGTFQDLGRGYLIHCQTKGLRAGDK